ncbi:competence protein ComEC [Thiogranum longum]|uniref:Competence protein ComEC n=1 Tax=Thiogranum longum TaxID=1537524 RepID=A0A4R1HDX9_9GAMM|nr:DNA internalization-related competence protein ComEC/Rec2 [Thiogranum longum]TCK18370.1 competence protein ComEC [Thiogranum longum]
MLYSALAMLAGISVFLTFMPVEGWWFAAPLAMFLFVPLKPCRLVGIAMAGFLWCGWSLQLLLVQQLPTGLENRDLLVEGVIKGMPEAMPAGRLRFLFEIDCYHDATGCHRLPLTARLNWYRNTAELHPGERWQLRVRLKRPHGFANPGGFDYERWLLSAGVRATGYIRSNAGNRRIGNSPGATVQHLREWLAGELSTRLAGNPMTAVLRALGVGDRSQMTSTQWDVLSATGTGHLLAISGLHVGLVASLVFGLVRYSWAWSGLSYFWPARHAAALASILAALGYSLLSGFQVPAQRALIMITVFMLSGFASQKLAPWHTWSLALILVMLLEPLSVLTPGLWLSFGAVAAILYLSVGHQDSRSKWRGIGRLQFLLPVALLVPGWVWFQQVSLVAPLVNLLAIPWTGFLIVPPLLAGLSCLSLWPVAAGWFLVLAATSAGLLWRGLEWFAGWPGNLLYLPAITPLGVAALVPAVVCVLAPGTLPVRLVGLLLLMPVMFSPPQRPDTGNVWLTVLDVGQGLSAVIQTRQRVLVFDAGPSFRSGFDTGEAVVAPYLRWQGYKFIDHLVISHSDNDHAGGAPAIRAMFNTGRIYSGEADELGFRDVHNCQAGQHWSWDQVQFEMLSPGVDRGSGNNASCVLRVTAQDGRSILLPGDIERRVENRLLQQIPGKLAATVLLAPHHGSLTSSSSGFVAAVKPELVIFSSGYLNRFGFPRPEVSRRYKNQGAMQLNTAEEGSIQVHIDAGRPVFISRYRRHRHFGALVGSATAQ